MEQLRAQKVHIDTIKDHCDWFQRNDIEMKKLPQILFHASKFLETEATKIQQKLDTDLAGGNRLTYFDAMTYILNRLLRFSI